MMCLRPPPLLPSPLWIVTIVCDDGGRKRQRTTTVEAKAAGGGGPPPPPPVVPLLPRNSIRPAVTATPRGVPIGGFAIFSEAMIWGSGEGDPRSLSRANFSMGWCFEHPPADDDEG